MMFDQCPGRCLAHLLSVIECVRVDSGLRFSVHFEKESRVLISNQSKVAMTAVALSGMLTSQAIAQSDQPDSRPANPASQSPLIQPDNVKQAEVQDEISSTNTGLPQQRRAKRPPLLREGSFLAGAAGRLARDKTTGGWKFVVQPDALEAQEGAVAREFVLLPCAKLSQMEQSIASTDLDIIFEMTGRIHVFEGRNYLLPLSAPRVQQYVEQVRPDKNQAADAGTTADEGNDNTDIDNANDDLVDDSDLTTEELIENLRSRVPVNRSLTPPPSATNSPTVQAENPDVLTAEDAAENLRPEGEFLLRRRGRVTRLSSGAWVYRFMADSTGLSDPPMVLLPCLLLERIQHEMQHRDPGDNFVMSGEVLTYQNQNYLLPTAYHVLRPDKNLHR